MNNQRRAAIYNISQKLEAIKAELDDLACEEQEAFDNLPYGLQSSERGLAMEDAARNLNDAVDYLNDALEALDSATI